MPVTKRKQTPPAVDEDLKRRLIDEWREAGSQEPRPDIIEEVNASGITTQVYVIWDDWGDLDQQERSGVIVEAFWEVYGENKGMELLVAMGLTPSEARRMRISRG